LGDRKELDLGVKGNCFKKGSRELFGRCGRMEDKLGDVGGRRRV